MCRHLAYLGPPVALAELLFDAPHGLQVQAQHPRLQTYGVDNPDGWAVGWWNGDAIHEYRTVTPIWNDTSFAGDARTPACVAAARYAAPGSALDIRSTAPLVRDGWLCSLNGIVEGFYDGVGDTLRARLSPARRAGLVTDVDTEVCFARVLDRIDSGEDPAFALAGLVKELEAETAGRFNFLLSDGHRIVATTAENSLYARTDPIVIASEPLDDSDAWQEIPDRSLVVANADGYAVEAR